MSHESVTTCRWLLAHNAEIKWIVANPCHEKRERKKSHHNHPTCLLYDVFIRISSLQLKLYINSFFCSLGRLFMMHEKKEFPFPRARFHIYVRKNTHSHTIRIFHTVFSYVVAWWWWWWWCYGVNWAADKYMAFGKITRTHFMSIKNLSLDTPFIVCVCVLR